MQTHTKRTTVSRTALAAAVTAALALPLAVNAERGDPVYYEPADCPDMDIDASGTLSPGEVQGRSPLAGQWDRFDMNGDGRIDREELDEFQVYEGATPEVLPAMPQAEPGPTAPPLGSEIGAPDFEALDINRDGVLSKGEAGGRKGLLDEFWPKAR